jgi:hypothetical protein
MQVFSCHTYRVYLGSTLGRGSGASDANSSKAALGTWRSIAGLKCLSAARRA